MSRGTKAGRLRADNEPVAVLATRYFTLDAVWQSFMPSGTGRASARFTQTAPAAVASNGRQP